MDDMIEYLLLRKALGGGGGGETASVLSFHITSELTQPLYLTQSNPGAVTIDWGDGSAPDNPSAVAASLSHTYAAAGDYTVRVSCQDGETWSPGMTSGSAHYGITGKHTTKTDTYPTLTAFTFGAGCTLDLGYAFTQCTGLEEIIFPDGITAIPDYCCYKCSGIIRVTIPDTALSIGSHAFDSCANLANASIPDSVTIIKDNAFYASGLVTFTMGRGIRTIGSSAFNTCASLSIVNISDLSAWCGITFGNESANPASIGTLCLNGSVLIHAIIPDGVTSISSLAFYNATSLSSVTIPDSVTIIGSRAFSSCTALSSVTFGDGVTSVGGYAFGDCSGLKRVFIKNVAAWCGISFNNDRANPLYWAKKLYLNGDLITALIIPSGVTSIGNYAFYNCADITSATIPSGVESIGQYAFWHCAGLASVSMPPTITSIAAYAFSKCTSLPSITIPAGATTIGGSAFENCTSVGEIISRPSAPPTINNSTFTGVPADCPIYVPAASVDAYKTKQYWSTRAAYIQALPAA